MKTRVVAVAALTALISGCTLGGRRTPATDASALLRECGARLSDAERVWIDAIDDPYTETVLRNRYVEMQNRCRECARRPGGFATFEEKGLCDRVRDPFAIYYNDLYVEANKLKEQTEVKADVKGKEPDTVAYEYKRRPSKENLEKLRAIFQQVHRYYVGWPYTWTRYINKYPFQKSRSDHFHKAFLDRDREYGELMRRPDADRHELKLARKRAEFAFARLKEEYVTNDLPPAGEVNALYLAGDLDEYHRLREEEAALARTRTEQGLKKEVVILVHGLSETRDSWGKLPQLLSREDVVNGVSENRYFKVYVFSYDTVEDSKSVEGFKNELAGFIRDILRDEGVEQVHLIGHSFGAVLCLKYINHESDELLGDVDRSSPAAVAIRLARSCGEGKCRQKVKSFISVAGSLSGSEVANIAGDRFIPQKQLFRKSLPMFRGGVPGYGDIQVRENQVGSIVNLTSFRRLDIEYPLYPPDLVRVLDGPARQEAMTYMDALRTGIIPVLCIIGDPVKIQSLKYKEGFLKMGEVWNIFRIDGFLRIIDSFRREEDDGLVSSYSANLNHTYLLSSGEDIGYKRASVRYNAHAHFSICRVGSRDHPTYRYIVAFLNGKLNPQIEAERFRIRRFGVLLRVFPDGVNPEAASEAHFLPEERVVYMNDRRLVIPPLRIERVDGGGERSKDRSWNISLGTPQWNRMTGVCIYEGRIIDASQQACVILRLYAKGFAEKRISVPVKPGEMSYAVNIVLSKTASAIDAPPAPQR
jgi:pimeloyl-ACP methyl ester carboxylesterase